MGESTETAVLAAGCFWPAQELLRHREGVVSTRVGYGLSVSGPAFRPAVEADAGGLPGPGVP
jgi:peptide methionine sulfoxide reductase MsrA